MGQKLALLLAASMTLSVAQAAERAYVEFLWSQPAPGALARGEASGFLLDGAHDHRVCVAALSDEATGPLRIDVRDAGGALVDSSTHPDFDGAKHCYDAMPATGGAPGRWTYQVYFDGRLAAARHIEVAANMGSAAFHAPSMQPYVLGRPNYDTSIPPGEYVGALSWLMEVDDTGKVVGVEIETARGVGERMRDRALAAGWMTRFPPDPARAGKTIKVRQQYDLATE